MAQTFKPRNRAFLVLCRRGSVITAAAVAALISLVAIASAQAQTLTIPDANDIARSGLRGAAGNAVVGTSQRGAETFGFAGKPIDGVDGRTAMFEIGSISKVFTGLLLAQAVERGDLELDDTVASVTSLIAGRQEVQGPAATLTLRQLVTHSACLPRTLAPVQEGTVAAKEITTLDAAQMWTGLATVKLTGAPPCPAAYSNLGFALLGTLLSARYGATWEQLVRERIAAPLGMADTVQSLDAAHAARMLPPFAGRNASTLWNMQAYSGAGALRSTTTDMLRFGRAVAAGAKGPLGPAADRMLTPLGRYQGFQIGYGVFIRGTPELPVYLHDGFTGGYRTLFMVTPRDEQVLIASVSNAFMGLGDLQMRVLAELFPVERKAVPVDAASLARFTGLYRTEDGIPIEVRLQDGVLQGRGGTSAFGPLTPVGNDIFTRPERGAAYDLSKPDVLTLRQGGAVYEARRVRGD